MPTNGSELQLANLELGTRERLYLGAETIFGEKQGEYSMEKKRIT